MTLNQIHQSFFSFRNGIVAKAFHDAGVPYKRIFGLQIPQLSKIAQEAGKDEVLAEELWNERECRESRLLSYYLFNPQTISREKALELASDILTREEADILAWRLLKNLDFAPGLLKELNGYMAEALQRNLQ